MNFLAITPALQYGLPACIAMAVACAMLSVPVVARRWAFIGEGISHSGFGGAGTAWLLAMLIPAARAPWVPFACVVIFCLVTALAIGFLSWRQRVNSDAAIGIFLVASLAWGFLARQVWITKYGTEPAGFEDFLFGQMAGLTAGYASAAVALSIAVVLVVVMLAKEILYYCFDPAMAEASGVPAAFIHYLLMMLVAVTIVIGVKITGSVLVTALLVLPGTTALQLTRSLNVSVVISIITALVGSITGLMLSLKWHFIPAGPAMVLVLFLQFVFAWAWGKVRQR